MAIEKKLKDQLQHELTQAKDNKKEIVFDCLLFASRILSEVRELINSLPKEQQELIRSYVFKGKNLTDAEEQSINFNKADLSYVFNSDTFTGMTNKLAAYEEDQQRLENIKQYLEDNKTRRAKK